MLRRGTRKRRSSAAPAYRDGPLSVRRPEVIRYGVGKCSLGAVLVACSKKGIATIMVRDRGGPLLGELRSRFPKAELIVSEDLKPLVAQVVAYIAAPVGRFPLALDLRGTAFQQRVWHEVQKIPIGRTSTYSRIAEAIGAPKAIRAVASSCARCWWSFAVPCHRVLHKGGVTAATADPEGRRRVRWVAYEAGLMAKRRRT